MAKVRAQAQGETVGCVVSGVWTLADGSPVAGQDVRFEPKKGGMWRGRVIGRDAITATTEADGRFSVALAPSTAIGRYTVKMGRLTFTADVPDAEKAELDTIVL